MNASNIAIIPNHTRMDYSASKPKDSLNPRKRVLIADNEAIDAAYIRTMLERNGWKADIVRDGENVLKKMEEVKYAFILMNGQLPVMDGLETTRMIRNKERESSKIAMPIPIIGVTAYSLDEEKRRFMNAGMDYCITKPVYKQSLFMLIDKICKEEGLDDE